MKDIKLMLIGISVILMVILVHLMVENAFITDFISILGVVLIFCGFTYKE